MNWKALAILCSLVAAGCQSDPQLNEPFVTMTASHLNETQELEIIIKYKGDKAEKVTAEVNGETVLP